jgi:hypothetical protein
VNRTFQFSVRWLLGLLAAIAIVFGAFTTSTEWLAALALRCILVVAFGAIGTMIAVGGRYARPFGIGAAFPLAIGAIWAVEPVPDFPLGVQGDIFGLKLRAGFLMAVAMLGGCSSVVVRALLLDQPPNTESR